MSKNALKLMLLLIVSMALFNTSCKSKKHLLKTSIKEHGFSYLYAKLIENQMEFDYLSAKFSLAYGEGKNKTNLRGQLRIKNDSLIWMSISPALGIEAARILLSKDSVKYINRLNKTYFAGEYELIDSIINTTIDFSLLQSMFVGNDLAQYDVNKFRSSIDNGLYKITIKERKKIKRYIKNGEIDTRILVQQIWLYPDNYRIARIDIKEQGENENNKLQVYYNNYVEINNQLFPSSIHIDVTSQKSITVDFEFNKVLINNKLSFPFKISKKYEKLF